MLLVDVPFDVVALVVGLVDGLVHALVVVVHVALDVVALALVLRGMYGLVGLEVDVSLGVLLFLWLELHVLLLHGGPPFGLLELAH